jgi:hypothetical protein
MPGRGQNERGPLNFMFKTLQIFTTLLSAIAMALALAHALELPGKLRLDKDRYKSVQSIYYPGFTVGGVIGEVGGTLALVWLLLLMPRGTANFRLTIVALLGFVTMQSIYWFITQPINKFWVKNVKLNRFSSNLFRFRATKKSAAAPVWTELRNRWEYSHVARAGCAAVSFIALLLALANS